MTLLIATDEAGYGPRLGPLVIVATAWRMRPGFPFDNAHAKLAEPLRVEHAGSFRIDDSKRIFQRPKATASPGHLPPPIDQITDAAAHWTDYPLPSVHPSDWLRRIAPNDFDALVLQPWFASLAEPDASTETAGETNVPLRSKISPESNISESIRQALVNHWSCGGWQLVSIAARVIDAARFNHLLDQSGNKANLLSDATCALAVDLATRAYTATDSAVAIHSDRLGGRAYYAGLLQHHANGYNVEVLMESNRSSRYRLIDSLATDQRQPSGLTNRLRPPTMQWSFDVNGDSFPPVALSSIVAKSTRERLMGMFNQFFQEHAATTRQNHSQLKPTAGYAVDAERFLKDIETQRKRLKIDDARLIRKK